MSSKTLFHGSAPVMPTTKCRTCGAARQSLPFCMHDGFLFERGFALGDRYTLDERIGAGSSALVFGGRDTVLGRSVAIKVMRPSAVSNPAEAQRFLRAVRLGSQLQHENIVVVHDCGEDRELGVVYLVMERLVGSTLADQHSRMQRMPWPRVISIAIQVCRALAESHRLGILHRDLSPRNVMLVSTSTRSDIVKLCDFGLARSSSGSDRVTATGIPVGTPAYMSPEQIRGDAAQDHRLDLYAVGSIAYELLSGALSHDAPNPVALIASKLSTRPTPLSERFPDLELPAGLERIIMQCLDPEPAGRPESATALEQQLLAIQATPVAPAIGDLVGQRVGGYRVLERINQGGMGEVFRVEHEVLKTRAALKVLLPEVAASPDALDRFVQEARTSSEIGSPHIPRCYDFGFLADKRAYMLMELVEGESVAAMIARHGPLPVAEVKQILQEAAEAFALAHDRGIIHRDIKPEHLIVERRGSALYVKILDFGIAKVFASNTGLTQAGAFMGTALYCSPEQVLGQPVDAASDVYALGATAYEMLTGQRPYGGEAGHVLGLKTQRDPIAMLKLRPELPSAVVSTIERMMVRDRSQRLATMRAAASEISAWPEDPVRTLAPASAPVTTPAATTPATTATTTTPPTTPPTLRTRIGARPSRAGRWIAGVTTACIVLVVAITLWPSSSPRPGSRPSEAAVPAATPAAAAESRPAAKPSPTATPAPAARPAAAASAAPVPRDSAPSTDRESERTGAARATEPQKAATPRPPESQTPRRPVRDNRSAPSRPASPKQRDVLIVDPW